MSPIMPKDFDPRWFAAPFTQYQLPVFSGVGKGLQGDSFGIELDDTAPSGGDLVGKFVDMRTGDVTETWRIPLIDLAPVIHYRVWKGVREIDERNMWVYYIEYWCEYHIDGYDLELWRFFTPYSMTVPYHGGLPIPTDYIVESDVEEA